MTAWAVADSYLFKLWKSKWKKTLSEKRFVQETLKEDTLKLFCTSNPSEVCCVPTVGNTPIDYIFEENLLASYTWWTAISLKYFCTLSRWTNWYITENLCTSFNTVVTDTVLARVRLPPFSIFVYCPIDIAATAICTTENFTPHSEFMLPLLIYIFEENLLASYTWWTAISLKYFCTLSRWTNWYITETLCTSFNTVVTDTVLARVRLPPFSIFIYCPIDIAATAICTTENFTPHSKFTCNKGARNVHLDYLQQTTLFLRWTEEIFKFLTFCVVSSTQLACTFWQICHELVCYLCVVYKLESISQSLLLQ